MTQPAPDGIPMSPSTMTLETYRFPAHRLRRQLKEPGKTPLVLVACGSCEFCRTFLLEGFLAPLVFLEPPLSNDGGGPPS